MQELATFERPDAVRVTVRRAHHTIAGVGYPFTCFVGGDGRIEVLCAIFFLDLAHGKERSFILRRPYH
jgi:hypothetical protein